MEQLLTVADVVERTRLSRTVVYELMRSGDLPAVNRGRSRRIREADLDEWIRQLGKQPTTAAA